MLKNATSPFRAAAGQSLPEFVVIACMLVLVLWRPLHKELMPALAAFYQSIVYPLSLP